jgi:hypothetical protein
MVYNQVWSSLGTKDPVNKLKTATVFVFHFNDIKKMIASFLQLVNLLLMLQQLNLQPICYYVYGSFI